MPVLSPEPTRARFRTVARWRTFLLLCAMVPSLLLGALVIYNAPQNQPRSLGGALVVPQQSLELGAPALATSYPPAVWSAVESKSDFGEQLYFNRESQTYRAQFSASEAIEIDQLVSDQIMPAMATWSFRNAQAGKNDLVWNEPTRAFLPMIDITLFYRSALANEQHAVCYLHARDSCRLVYLWARYGQYLVRVRLVEEKVPLTEPIISGVFEQIDTHITNTLQAQEKVR